MIQSIPLFAFLLIVYNVIVFFFPEFTGKEILSVRLLSGTQWVFNVEALILSIGLFCLYVEIFRATKSTSASILNHSLSMLVFVIILVEFLGLQQMGNSTFFLILLMSFIDVIAGFTVTLSSARRDIDIIR